MQRREFIAGLGSAAAAWPAVARAQRPDRMRRIGVLMGSDENGPDSKARLSGFMQGLAELGWTDGRNLRMDVRWGAGNVDRMRMFAKELVGLQPDVILASFTPATAAHTASATGALRGRGRFADSGPRLDRRRHLCRAWQPRRGRARAYA